MHYLLASLLACCALLAGSRSARAHEVQFNITVPEFQVNDTDAYICVTQHLPSKPHKLVGVVPRAKSAVVHHILLFGCAEPQEMPQGDKPAVWRCDMAATCKQGGVHLYGWGRDAPELKLPEGVGYSVGPHTGIRYIVAQFHYLDSRPAGDHSGVTLLLRPHPLPYAAGLLSYAASFTIPPHTKRTLVNNTCCYKGHQLLTMFAVRVHTHVMGRSVYLEREAWNKSGVERLAEGDPQLPQSFVPSQPHVLAPGDRLKLTCEFDSSNRSTPTYAGSSHSDEMCNMYVMLYAKRPFATMCFADSFVIGGDQPGGMPRQAQVEQDPTPSWAPPRPQGDGKQGVFGSPSGVATGPDGMLWVLYRGSGAGPVPDAAKPAKAGAGGAASTTNSTAATAATLAADDGKPAAAATTNSTTSSAAGNAQQQPQARLRLNQQQHQKQGHQLPATAAGLAPVPGPQRLMVPDPVVAQLDPDTGAVLQRWGGGMFRDPYSISVDVMGSVWVVDRDAHTVVKLSPNGTRLLSVGQAGVPGKGANHLCGPTQVSVLRDGSFLVADGYCNERVVKYSREGKYLGASDHLPATVHGVLVDECDATVYAASRQQGKLHLLDLTSLKAKGVRDLSGHGQLLAVHFGPYGEPLALMQVAGQDACLVHALFPGLNWTLPGSAQLTVNDFVMGAAPLELTGAGDRLLSAYVAHIGDDCAAAAPAADAGGARHRRAAAAGQASESAGAGAGGCGALRKYVWVPTGTTMPTVAQLAAAAAVSHTGGAHVPGPGSASKQDDGDADADADYEGNQQQQREEGQVGEAISTTFSKEEFEIFEQDREASSRAAHARSSVWFIVLGVAVLVAVAVVRLSRCALAMYVEPPRERGPGAGGDGGAASAGFGAAPGGAAGRDGKGVKGGEGEGSDEEGGGPAAGRAARDVQRARERERLLLGRG